MSFTATSTKRCPKCNKLGIVINSNNNLVPGICIECLQKEVKWNDLNSVDMFCRTFNFPFVPDSWIRISNELKENSFETYIQTIMDEHKNNPEYADPESRKELWSSVNKIWNRNMEFKEILSSMESVKDDWLRIQESKWGPGYEFSEYLRLEDITNSTIRSTGTTNPLAVDTIRKLAATSIRMDRAIKDGEIKEAAELSKMYQILIKSGGLEDIVDVTSDTDVISNIADLCNYLEDNGFEFQYYDKVSRDIVDKTIQDQQQWVRRLVLDSTGIIQQQYQVIEDSYRTKAENDKYQEATTKVTLEDIIREKQEKQNEEIDKELEEEDYDFSDDDLDDDMTTKRWM